MKKYLIRTYLMLSIPVSIFCLLLFLISFINRYEMNYLETYLFILIMGINSLFLKKEEEYAKYSIEIPIYSTLSFVITLFFILNVGSVLEKTFWISIITIAIIRIIMNKKEMYYIGAILGGVMAGIVVNIFIKSFE